MQCPNPRCRNSIMSYMFAKGSKRIYRCPRCGAEKAEVLSNSDYSLKGSYIVDGSLKKMDRETRG